MQKIALITGGNRGLGLETAKQLLEHDYRVILTTRDSQKGQQAAASLSGQAYTFTLDVTDSQSIAAVYAYTQREFGRLDVLINNAGIFIEKDRSIRAIPENTFRLTFETNTFGPLWLCQAFIPMMVAQNYGRVVNVSSGMGQINAMNDYGAAYRISKLALNAITRIFADAVRGSNVLVNAVCPGWVRSDMGGRVAPRTLQQGASGIVWAATLPVGGPNGGFFRDGKILDW